MRNGVAVCFYEPGGGMDCLSVHTDARGHVCDRLWSVTNVFTKQKYTESSMRSFVYPKLLRIAMTLDDPVNCENHVVDEEGQVCVFYSQSNNLRKFFPLLADY